MAGLSMVIKCRLVAIILSVAAVAVTTAGGCYCSLGMTSSSDVIIILATGCVSVMLWSMTTVAVVISSMDPAESHSARTVISQCLLQKMISLRGRIVLHRLRHASTHLAATQTCLLSSILKHNAKTAFGRRYRFVKVLAAQHGAGEGDVDAVRWSYVANVPQTTHKDYVDDIQRLLESREAPTAAVLTADHVEFLSYSSGTSGKNKLVPLTLWPKLTAATVVGPLMYHVLDRSVSIGGRRRLHRVLDLSYRAAVGRSQSGLPVGPISSFIGRLAPYVVSPPQVYSVTDEPTAMHLHALFALRERQLERIEALFSTLVYAFWTHVERHWQRICDEIERGTIRGGNIPGSDAGAANAVVKDANSMESAQSATDSVAMLVASVAKQLRPDRERACELRGIFSGGFTGVALRVWPGLRAVRMVATGGFAAHARLLADTYMTGVTQLSLVHAASEGFYGVNISAGEDDKGSKSFGPNSRYTVLPQLGFYEFIRHVDVDQRQPPTLFADQVYFLVFTACVAVWLCVWSRWSVYLLVIRRLSKSLT